MVDVGDCYCLPGSMKRQDWREHLAKSRHRSLHGPTIYFPLRTFPSNSIQLYKILVIFSDGWGDKTIKCSGVVQNTSISDIRLEGVRKSVKHLELGAPWVQVSRITAKLTCSADCSRCVNVKWLRQKFTKLSSVFSPPILSTVHYR
jgi:hypothetical protein